MPETGTSATLPVGEYDDVKRQKLFEERHNEYLQLQQQVTSAHRQLNRGQNKEVL